MNSLSKRKKAFTNLGAYLQLFSDLKSNTQKFEKCSVDLKENQKKKFVKAHLQIVDIVENSTYYNPWFTKDFLLNALLALGKSLKEEKLTQWIGNYKHKLADSNGDKTIGVVMAGNLPLVGFHDYLCVLFSGNKLKAKLSKDDSQLLPLLHQILSAFEPELEEKADFTLEKLADFDAIIATGSNNTARYFEYYFGKYPNIIRKNRNGIALLNGKENQAELEALADDVFLYFGLGCRSVSKLFVPRNYNFDNLFAAFDKYRFLAYHHKYVNNYEYNKSIYMLNKIPYFDNGFVLIKEDAQFSSPISVIYFEYYDKPEALIKNLSRQKDKIQCVVSKENSPELETIPLGKAQQPELFDYADGIDTMNFILDLK